MDENWVLILSTTEDEICKKAKALLEKEKINSIIDTKNEQNEFIEKYELFVDMNDIGNARTILKGLLIE